MFTAHPDHFEDGTAADAGDADADGGEGKHVSVSSLDPLPQSLLLGL